MALLLVLAAIAAGVFLPLQAGVNAMLADHLGNPLRASLVSFVVGALVLLVIVFVAYREGGREGSAAWWVWVGGGTLGAFYVTAALTVGPRLGATAFFGILVAAQLAASVVLDRFGWLGFPEHGLSPARLLGVALLVAGALLVRVY